MVAVADFSFGSWLCENRSEGRQAAQPAASHWSTHSANRTKVVPMVKPIMNLDEVEFDDIEENGPYTSSRGRISGRIGARKLGYNLTVLPPGKVQCPFHSHHGEEEMFLIIEGEGELRFGDQRYPIRKHDVIACPPAGRRSPTRSSTPARRRCATSRSRRWRRSTPASTRIRGRF